LNFNLPKIYPITDARLAKISHAAQVKRLIDGGARFIQLRDKYAAPQEFYESARESLRIARKHDAKLIINDRVDIALALKADGIHLGQDDLPPDEARKILGEKAIIGFSTHNVRQAIKAVRMPIDYVAVGPIFATATKENADEIVGLDGLKKARAAIGDFPLVAIGGINSSNLREVLDSGANSAAIVSGLLSSPEEISRNYEFYTSL
jgi:thiamine-phosphate pyrophosphorylase